MAADTDCAQQDAAVVTHQDTARHRDQSALGDRDHRVDELRVALCPTRQTPGSDAHVEGADGLASKDEIIDATAEQGMTTVRDVFVEALQLEPLPSPRELVCALVDALHRRAGHARYDLTKLAIQTWAEAVRRPHLRRRAGDLYGESLRSIEAILRAWQARGEMSGGVDVGSAAYVLSSLMHGLVVNHHLLRPVAAADVVDGLQALGLFVADSPGEPERARGTSRTV